jgi:hypothetical protein
MRPVRQRAIRRALDRLPEPATVAGRIDAILAQATADEIAAGVSWYGDAGKLAHVVAVGHGIPDRSGAGIVAALSPQCSWDENVARALAHADGESVGAMADPLRKADAIRDGADPYDALGGRKVRSFWRNIDGHESFVTVDRHAVAIAFDRPLSDTEIKVLERPGAYVYIAACYRAAARRHGIPASTLQAITWIVWRRLKGLDDAAAF